MSERYILGIYGVVGSGKSTVSKYLMTKNWRHINQDILGHEVIQEHSEELIRIFGSQILDNNGHIDRKKIGELVFHNKDLLSQLVQFSYPFIIEKTLNLLQSYQENVIIEGAFFYKIKDYIPYTHLAYIFMDDVLLRNRLIQRGHSTEWIKQVLDSQKDIILHKNLADFVLNNDKDLSFLYKQIDQILELLS